MASKTFALRVEPHEAIVGDTILLLEPEVIGADFAEAYDALREVQQKVKSAEGNKASSTKTAKASTVDAKMLTELSAAMRSFVRRFLLEESRPVFDDMRLPDRVLVDLMQYVAELYGGGQGNRAADGGTSSG
jgi:cobalamin-dependent methionine synthase I